MCSADVILHNLQLATAFCKYTVEFCQMENNTKPWTLQRLTVVISCRGLFIWKHHEPGRCFGKFYWRIMKNTKRLTRFWVTWLLLRTAIINWLGEIELLPVVGSSLELLLPLITVSQAWSPSTVCVSPESPWEESADEEYLNEKSVSRSCIDNRHLCPVSKIFELTEKGRKWGDQWIS